MATSNDISRSFAVSTAMSAGRRVEIAPDGKIRVGSINKVGVGYLVDDTSANSYENPKVRLHGAGTVRASLTGTPLTAGDLLYAVTNGQLSGTNSYVGLTAGGRIVGCLVETTGSGQDGNLFEVSMTFENGV